MTPRSWLRGGVLALGAILAVATLSQAIAQAKDKIPVNPKLLTAPPEGAVILFDGKPEQMRDNWYARRSTDPAGWTVDDKGVATPNHRDISSKQEFGDCYFHCEFREPLTSCWQQRRRLRGALRDSNPQFLRQEARSPRVRRDLQPDAAAA